MLERPEPIIGQDSREEPPLPREETYDAASGISPDEMARRVRALIALQNHFGGTPA